MKKKAMKTEKKNQKWIALTFQKLIMIQIGWKEELIEENEEEFAEKS